MLRLIDSSWFIGLLRARQDPRLLSQPYLLEGQMATCGVVRAEALRGMTKPTARADLSNFFDLITDIPADARIWDDVVSLAWMLDRQGITLPLTDIIISACAFRVGASLVTLDHHFLRVPGLTVHQTLP